MKICVICEMPEDKAYDFLDDIDFYYNKVKCRKIEKLISKLDLHYQTVTSSKEIR